MLKPSIAAMAFVAFAFTAAGCSLHPSGQAKTDQSAQCAKLKREFVNLQSAHNTRTTWATSVERAEAKKRLVEANCI